MGSPSRRVHTAIKTRAEVVLTRNRTDPSAKAALATNGWKAYSPRTLLQLTAQGPTPPTVPAELNVFTLYVSLCAQAPWMGVDQTSPPSRSVTGVLGNRPPAPMVTYRGSVAEVTCLP